MNIKGVFLDWGFTVAHPEPEGHIIYHQCAQEFGVILPLNGLFKAIHEADNQVPVGAPPRYSNGKDEAPFLRWWEVLLGNIGVSLPNNVKLEITKLAGERVRKATWVLYDDVLPTMKILKRRGLIIGLISNISIDRAGLEKYLDVTVTAKDVGAGKPDEAIFLEALRQANLKASEAIYVGDQYNIDILGAGRAGLKPILIDHYNISVPTKDCIFIRHLLEITNYL